MKKRLSSLLLFFGLQGFAKPMSEHSLFATVESSLNSKVINESTGILNSSSIEFAETAQIKSVFAVSFISIEPKK